MLARLICHDLLGAGAALSGIGVDGDGLIWLTECGSLPRSCVTDMIAHGADTGLPVLAATTSPPVASDLAELTNVLVAHRMNDDAAARQLAGAAGQLAGDAGQAGRLAALRDGEFLLAVAEPRRVVPRGVLVRARTPPFPSGSTTVGRVGSKTVSRAGGTPAAGAGGTPAAGPRRGLKGRPPA
jgi:hypothetical protein